jgi:hypothetical protein
MDISGQVSSSSLLDICAGYCRELWWEYQELLELSWGSTLDLKWSVMVLSCLYFMMFLTPINVTYKEALR